MTRHLLRLIWNRKRQNFLLTVEIFFSFLTLFGVVLFAVHYANNARQPLGSGVANCTQQTRLRVVEQREVCLPRGRVGALWRNGPPRLANRAGERIDLAVQCARRQQMPPVREMQHELPDRVSVLGGFAKGDVGADSTERFAH